MRESLSVEDNAKALSRFLSITVDQGREIAQAEYLFSD
jgi:hypothetical protein